MKLQNETEVLLEILRKHVEKNAHAALNQKKHEGKYNELANKYEEIKRKIFSQKIKFNNINEFIERSEECDSLITEFDEVVWDTTIDKAVVDLKESIKFYFKDGKIIKYSSFMRTNIL